MGTNTFSGFSFETDCKNFCYGPAKIVNCRTTEGLDYQAWKNGEGTFIKLTKPGTRPSQIISDENTQSTYVGIDVSEVPTFTETVAGINAKLEKNAELPDDEKYYNSFYELIEYAPSIISSVTRYSAGSKSADKVNFDGKVVVYWNKKAYIPRAGTKTDVTQTLFIPLVTVIDNPIFFDVKVSDCVIKLNDSYCPVGINKIHLKQTQENKAKVYNKDNILIFDGTDKPAGIYEIYCITTPVLASVFSEIDAPSDVKTLYADRIRNVYTGSNEEWIINKLSD